MHALTCSMMYYMYVTTYVRRSFLYYLDGVSLLLYRIPATFQTRLDHIAVGYGHTLALGDEGMVFSWGVGSKGQLGHGDRETRRKPQLVESIKGKRIIRYQLFS